MCMVDIDISLTIAAERRDLSWSLLLVVGVGRVWGEVEGGGIPLGKILKM